VELILVMLKLLYVPHKAALSPDFYDVGILFRLRASVGK